MVTELGPGREFDLIRTFLEHRGSAPGPSVRVGPGDDCAVVTGSGVAVSVDMLVEFVHFRRPWLEPDEIGYRAAAAALSDLAAVAARPIGILVAVALGPDDVNAVGRALMAGLAAAAGDVGATVLGGDVTRSPGPLVIDVTALGEAYHPVLRTGARPGHGVWVTGRLGAAAAAVDAWLAGEEPDAAAREAFARPVPRVEEALWLDERSVPAAMVDLSDGLAGDAAHLAAAGGVRIVIRAADVPVAEAAAQRPEPLRLAAAGGEDYELCFTAAAGAVETIQDEFADRFDVTLTHVGDVEEGQGAVVVDEEGEEIQLQAFQHWGAP